MYYVVDFVDEKDKIEVIPCDWYNEETLTACWPNVTSPTTFRQLLTEKANPQDNWIVCNAKVVFKSGTK